MGTAVMLVALLLGAGVAPAEDAAEALTRGKLAEDLGDHAAAATAFASVADDGGAAEAQRWEALVRLGVARREGGDRSGSVEAFERAYGDYGSDPEALRFLLAALGSALPGQERWEEVWQQVSFSFDRAGGKVRVHWPNAPEGMCPCDGTPVNLDFKDGDLNDILRLMADVSGLNVVVQPGVHGTSTLAAHEEPWDRALENALAPHGYVARRSGNVVWVGRPKDAPWPAGGRAFTGKPIEFEFVDVDLIEALEQVAAHGGVRVQVPEGVGGRVTFELVAVPWDQAFDLLAGVNGLTWTRTGDVIEVAIR